MTARVERGTIIVSGMVAGVPGLGGAAWAVLQYVLGLRRLGHDVWLVDPVSQEALRPEGAPLEGSENAAYFRAVAQEFGLAERSALLLAGTRRTVGVPYDELLAAAGRADFLVNVSGMLADEALLESVPVRMYLDLDPAFTQLWEEVQGIDMGFGGHTHFATVGLAIGRPGCPVPTCGLRWATTLPPVVLERWPPAGPLTHDGLTTVGNWRGYGSIEWNGQFYGQKGHAVRELMALPTLTAEKVMPAFSIHPDEGPDLEALDANGWHLLDPADVAGTPAAYRSFIQGSKAELGVAKTGYVLSRCGWFSDRSACYLASGRPVLAQDTGFGDFLPTGEGLFAFRTVDDVLAAIDEVNGDYPRHARAARAIAEEHFDSDRVLARLLEAIAP